MKTDTPDERADAELLGAVRTLYERHEIDNGNGGVHWSYVASYLGRSEPRTRSRLRELADRGRLERVQGIDPETGLPRLSYVPIETK